MAESEESYIPIEASHISLQTIQGMHGFKNYPGL